jgi:hypothetical protein
MLTEREVGALTKPIGAIVRDFVTRSLAGVVARLDALEQRLAGLPAPKDGADGAAGANGKDGLPGERGTDGSNGTDGRDGRDGLPGNQGEKGKDGRDGANGVDGKDGLGFDDLVVDYDGEREFAFKFQRGAEVKAFPFTLPLVLDRGVWREGAAYAKGDGVTWAGSFWIAQRDTVAKPDAGNGDFRLAVKRGRDGK